MPIISSAIGNMLINSKEGFLSELRFTEEPVNDVSLNEVESEAKKQLDEYFAGKRKSFDIPINLNGTDFQQKVWMSLKEIPFGQMTTYLKLSQTLGNPAAIRAIGAAIGANPILIVLPCHRVIGTNGQLTGYAGGLDRKRSLLDLEGHASQGSLF
jgi:methylated-DNA-[protein]-cysteine S-methyltransferase